METTELIAKSLKNGRNLINKYFLKTILDHQLQLFKTYAFKSLLRGVFAIF
ncbi:hypothetical protein EV05_0568 [Prochlorococcus sp. MIT 0601]|nr:hypothetical protein EV05_0568 [Prochlorococcus sp. MIT 0601]